MNNDLTTLRGKVSHHFVELPTNVRMHYVDNIHNLKTKSPDLITFVFVHGWPEFWFSWRYQLEYFSSLGYRVIAIDQRGFGETRVASSDVSSFSQQNAVSDLVHFFDRLHLRNVVLVGHDWGGQVVWNFAFLHSARLLSVISLCTPFFGANPHVDPSTKLMGKFDYQKYFQQPGVAETELEKDMKRTFACIMRSTKPEDSFPNPFIVVNNEKIPISTATVTKRGGLLVGYPENVQRSKMLSEEELKYYAQTFERSGMRGPLSWYRNLQSDWNWARNTFPRDSSNPELYKPLSIPALMVSAEKDRVLTPDMAAAMSSTGLFTNLEVKFIKEAGHWVQQETPDEVNKIIHEWIEKTLKQPRSKL